MNIYLHCINYLTDTHKSKKMTALNFLIQTISVVVPTIYKITHRQMLQKVMVFAGQIMRHDSELTRADAMKEAWATMKSEGEKYRLIKFTKIIKATKKRPEQTIILQRIVMADSPFNYYTPKGTGRPLKEGQVLFADAARIRCQKDYVLISTYQDRIIQKF